MPLPDAPVSSVIGPNFRPLTRRFPGLRRLRWLSTVVAAAVLLWCVVVGVRIWTTPVNLSGVEWRMGPAGARAFERIEPRSFSDLSGLGVTPLVIPVLLAGWATWAAWRQRTRGLALATLMFLTFCLVAGFSIGGAYVPAGLGLVAASACSLLAATARDH